MISFFYSCGLPTIVVYCEHLLEVPTILLAIWPRLHLGMPSVLGFYYPSHDKSLSILILSYTFLSPLMGKALGLSLPISLAGIKWSQPVCYLFWVKMPPQQSTFQKRPWLDTKFGFALGISLYSYANTSLNSFSNSIKFVFSSSVSLVLI